MICIVGINGNQGKRYKSICEYLGISYIGIDSNARNEDEYQYLTGGNIEAETIILNSDKVIIATPTRSHLRLIERFGVFKKPVLCETPIVKTIEHLNALEEFSKINDQIYMVNHLSYLKKPSDSLETSYDYYKSYGEGLSWDAMQVIGLAKNKYKLSNKSSLFRLEINGTKYERSEVDLLYQLMVQDFNGGMKNLWGIDDIIRVTKKTITDIENRKD